jgi:hypothetical protein
MKHLETRLCGPDSYSGRFFCPATGPLTLGPLTLGPLTLGPLTLPSPRRGEGETAS